MRKFSLRAIASGILSLVGCSPSVEPEVPPDIPAKLNDADEYHEFAEFIPENPERPFYFAFSMLHQPDPVLRNRIASTDSIPTYMKEVERTVKEYLETIPEDSGRTCSIVFALKPGRQSRFWVEYHPEPLPGPIHDELVKRLEALEAPMVRDGPVSIAMFGLLWGGIGRENHPNFSMVPKEWQEAAGGIIPDGPLSKLWPD